MMRVRNPLNEKDIWTEVSSVAPPSSGFPYWTIYPIAKSEEGYNKALFFHIDQVPAFEIQDDNKEEIREEVTLTNGVRNNQMPSVLSEYRDITGGDE